MVKHAAKEKKFPEFTPAMSELEAITEAGRCLFCHDAPCIQACPARINVPFFIRKILTGNMLGAARTILDANILGGTCARVCPVDELCQGACLLKNVPEPAVSIARLQRYAVDWLFAQREEALAKQESTGKRFAVIGGGPAGLSCAAELAKKGHSVTLHEARQRPGGLNTYAIAMSKTRIPFIMKEIALIRKLGIRIKTNSSIKTGSELENLLAQNSAVFIGIGLGRTANLNIRGENLRGVIDVLDFLEKVKTGKGEGRVKGKKAAVIGAGNSALDAAISLRILGAEQVAIIYRRTEHEMPAYAEEFRDAKLRECRFHWLTMPIEIVGKNQVEGVKCIRTRLGAPDSSGRRRPVAIPGTEFIIPADIVIKAMGQQSREDLVLSMPGLKRNMRGLINVNADTRETSIRRLFAGGDCVNGGAEVVQAVAEGKLAAEQMLSMYV